MKERAFYALLAIVFAFSRLGYYLAGVRFDARPVLHYFQFIDPELLKHRLFESLLYLHIQPPGWNLFVGTILQLFPTRYPAAFHLTYLLFGLGICWSTYHLMRVLHINQWLAFTLTTWFIVSPAVVLFENYLLYEYLVSFLLLISAIALFHLYESRRAVWIALFFLTLFALVMVRNFFHLAWFAVLLAALAFLCPVRRRAVLLYGSVPLLAIIGLYSKNFVLFGNFSGSTWIGMNMDVITAHQLTPGEARNFVQRGVISPVSLLAAGSPAALYRPYISMPPRTGIPILDDCITSTGATNFNCLEFLEIQRTYAQDGLALLKAYPVVYLRSEEAAWFTYFLPASDFPFFDLNRPRIRSLDRFWNLVFFGQFKDASDRKELRRLSAQGNRLFLALYTGTFLIIGMPALWLWGAWQLVTGIRRQTLDRGAAILLGFLLLNIAYVTLIANLLSSFENNRYRFPLDSFYLVLLGVCAKSCARRRTAYDAVVSRSQGSKMEVTKARSELR